MKKKTLSRTLSIIILLGITFAAAAAVVPSLSASSAAFKRIRSDFLTFVRDKTGLTLSYKALSPSVLSGIRMSDITVSDIETDAPVLQIRSIKLRWNILKVLTGRMSDAFGELIISGVQADYDDLTQYSVRERLFTLLQASGAGKEQGGSGKGRYSGGENGQGGGKNQTDEGAFEDVLFSLPLRIRVKNASFVYADASIENELKISNLKINRPAKNDAIQLQLSGKNSLCATAKNPVQFGKLALDFSVQAKITADTENSFAQLRFSSLRESDYLVPALNLYASYADRTFRASVMQNVLPFVLTLNADTVSEHARLALQAQHVNLFDLCKPKKSSGFLNTVSRLFVSGEYEALWNWKTNELSYKADGSLALERSAKRDAADISFRFSGSEENADIDFVKVSAPFLSADYTGSLDIRNLRPQGTARIHSAVLPNGNAVSADVYMESFGNESLFFVPQLYFGENSLTALQLRLIGSGLSRDFTFEAFDYSKADTAGAGALRVNGSFSLAEQKELQMQLSTENLFLDSIGTAALWCAPKKSSAGLSAVLPFLSPYICSADLFFSTDFKTFTYNSPYVVVANTQKDDQVLLLSVDGTESAFQISRFDMTGSGQSVRLQANADLSSASDEVLFSASLFINSLPYTFSGAFVPSRFLNISGDYNFSASAYADKDGSLSGSLSFTSLPLELRDVLFSSSFSVQFDVRTASDWNVRIEQIEIAEVSKRSRISPRISLSGSADPSGLYLNKAVYADELSTLNGNLNALWNFSDGIFDSLTLNAAFADSFSDEKYSAVLQLHNPERIPNGQIDFFEHIYFSLEAEIRSLPAGRFIALQNEGNTVSGSLSALGTISNPSLRLSLERASFSAGTTGVLVRGNASLEDKNLVFSDCDLRYGTLNARSFSGNFSLKDFSGKAEGRLEGRVGSDQFFRTKTFESPFTFVFIPSPNEEKVPLKEKSFRAELMLAKLEGSFFEPRRNYKIALERTSGRFDFTAGSSEGLTAVLFDDGEISVNAGRDFPVRFSAAGTVQKGELFLAVDTIAADAKTFSRLVDLPAFSLYSGSAEGSGTITGTLADPVINAEFIGKDMTIGVPDYIGEKMTCSDFRVKTTDGVFSAADSLFIGEKSGARINLSVDLALKKLLIDNLSLKVHTLDDTRAEVRYAMPNGVFTGKGKADIAVQLDKDLVDVSGSVEVADLEAVIILAAERARAQSESETDVALDLTITTDTKARLFIPSKVNPLLRGLVTQTSPLRLQMDTRYGTSSFTGAFSMKGGEILYLNRTFYIREASAVLNESTESFDPRLSAKAEIRERDKDGNPVRIMLTVADQPLSRLNPSFSSVPVKTQQEIMTLLGQIFLGDVTDTNPLALIGGLADYGAQIAVFSTIENRLRDLLKFDIFSIRTMFLQNAFASALNLNTGNQMSAGNFLDNTTVYIGKYFGDTLYADAMMHLSYDDNLKKRNGSTGGLVFQPEIGFELPTPFAAIRWSIAPELNSDWKLLVPHTSISFSWKFNF